MLTLIVGNKNYSSWSLRAWLALAATGAKFEETVIRLQEPDSKANLLAHSPSAKVPVLKDGAVTVWESIAICEYVAEKFPAARLWPQDPAARAHARSISAEMHAGFANIRKSMPHNIRASGRKVEIDAATKEEIARVSDIWSDTRQRFGAGGAFLYGHFTIADAMYAPVISRFRTYGVTLSGAAAAYADAVWEMPSMRQRRAEAAAEPWVIERNERGR